MIRILFIGDVVGSLGRETIAKVLPSLKKRDKVDLVIANGENIAHGRGASEKTIREVQGCGVDFFTSGDHIFFREEFKNEIESLPIIRPLNFPPDFPGNGYFVFDLGKKGQVLIVNLLGRTFIDSAGTSCPFRAFDDLFVGAGSSCPKSAGASTAPLQREDYAAVVVDVHAETTSEKMAMGYYLDGRVSAVVGTHTHVPTADCRVLPDGTAYVTDAGMVGPQDSILGVKKEIIIARQKDGKRDRFEWVEEGEAVFNSVLFEIDGKTGKAKRIERRDERVSL